MAENGYRKKLIEVALPLAEINDASAYDKMPGIGPHPKGLHHWWARLPLPSARAVLFASLVDDPSADPRFAEGGEVAQDEERERLFGILRRLMQKKIHEHPEAYAEALREIKRCCGGDMPTVLDPFCGGGSIPLEAQRLGLKAQASDLNPVPVLINKAMLEIVPKYADQPPVNPDARTQNLKTQRWTRAKGLAEDVRYYGDVVLKEARKKLGKYYPEVKLPKQYGGKEATVLTWIWARTVKCPNPACRAEMPLISSFWLATKGGKKAWIEPVIDRKTKKITYQVKTGDGEAPESPKIGRGAKFRCLCCNEPPPNDNYIKDEGMAGRIGQRLIAIVADGGRGRIYLGPEEDHETAAKVPEPDWVPDFPIEPDPRNIWCMGYGFARFHQLFTARQLKSLSTLADAVRKCRADVKKDAEDAGIADPAGYSAGVILALGFAVDRCADFGNALCTWNPSNEKVMHLFGRAAIPMVWDFAEANFLAEAVGGWPTCKDYVAECVEVVAAGCSHDGVAQQLDAATAVRQGDRLVISTDPPYYDNISYGALSDFFYVWLRRTVGDLFKDVCKTVLVPKGAQLIAAPEMFDGDAAKARDHFESGFKSAFSLFKKSLDGRFPLTVYYAFKQEESEEEGAVDLTTGWETLLEALNSSGYQITATWPVRASQKWRMNAMDTNALASYIVLACRPRTGDAAVATRQQFLLELKRELPGALRRLRHGNIPPVDLAQAAIGPGMAVFSKYGKVVEADGTLMSIRTALSLINERLEDVMEGEFDAETRWALAWYEQHAHEDGPFGDAETLSKAKNVGVNGLVEDGILLARGGKVRLKRRDELAAEWDPATDARLTTWEVCQCMIRALEQKGEAGAADVLARLTARRLTPTVDPEVARDLAYRLFGICERKKWSKDAIPYNALVVAWPELVKQAREIKVIVQDQPELTL